MKNSLGNFPNLPKMPNPATVSDALLANFSLNFKLSFLGTVLEV